ncbi:DSBA-like thioredoxin domain protein [Psychrobacter pasteurii]|uniref:DSBA-like thioredoxin domain protein n=1 Tax=Psychrobacter pasteurii TaxID=1945520 RepID=A0A1R4EH20_9GAMM|nr:DsbA family oxidoreductase [Psychrobacter pasteurii]SJM37786.1 DSBA-like thioredoxin domain protein [Psychrobacter pasteurii]
MSEALPALRIDIVSDIVCPWCVVGYRQLAEALKQTHTAHEIHWHPFELNPDMPEEGQNLREQIMEKYGSSQQESDASRVRITEAGAEVGFEFNFTDDTRMHNTFKAHQLLNWAADYGLKHELKQALFAAHFTDNRNISDEEVLADIAEDVGLDREQALAVLADQRYAEVVRTAEQQIQQQGIQSVPAVIFNQRHLVSGAQGVENFKSILNQLAAMK